MHPLARNMISVGMVGCMLVVARSEFADHGKAPGEIHLITAMPLGTANGTVGSSVGPPTLLSGLGFQNAIIEADYLAAPDSRPLPFDGVTIPTWSSPPTWSSLPLKV